MLISLLSEELQEVILPLIAEFTVRSRNLFSLAPESQARGYKPGRFSFNVKGGRCETCQGGGMKVIEMNFLPDVHVECENCNGKRFNRETLEIRFKGKSIADILEMTVNHACDFFESHPKNISKIKNNSRCRTWIH